MTVELQVSRAHYHRKYDTEARFSSYWHQFDLIARHAGGRVLEVGKGTGLMGWFCAQRGIEYTSVDLAADLEPDCVASVTNLPLPNGFSDTSVCFQVLEHMQMADAAQALRELHRVTRRVLLVSLPDASPCLRFFMKLPGVRPLRMMLPVPFWRLHRMRFDGEHYWEVNYGGTSPRDVRRLLCAPGFSIVREFRPFNNPAHRFFVCEKVAAQPEPGS